VRGTNKNDNRDEKDKICSETPYTLYVSYVTKVNYGKSKVKRICHISIVRYLPNLLRLALDFKIYNQEDIQGF